MIQAPGPGLSSLKFLIVKTFVMSMQFRASRRHGSTTRFKETCYFKSQFFGNIFEGMGKRIIQFSLNEVGNSVVHKETGRGP